MQGLAVFLALGLALPGADVRRVVAEPKVEQGFLGLSVPAPGTVNGDLERKLQDGLKHRVRYTVVLHGEGETTPYVTDELTTEVVYDLWDEAFVVSHTEGGLVRRQRVKKAEKVRAILEKPRFHSVIPLSRLDLTHRYWVDMVVDVDPVSQEVLDRTRELLSPPPGDSETRTARGLLGNVAKIFVNESTTSSGNATLAFSSGPFAVPQEASKP